MKSRITGFVLRARDKDVTALFYERLGLSTNHHEHGGPMHYEVGEVVQDFVVEIYQQSTVFPKDTIMLEVDSIEEALKIADDYGIKPRGELKDVGGMKFIYIVDHECWHLMLVEKKTT